MANDQLTCQTCGGVFPSRQELDRHTQRNHAEPQSARVTSAQPATDSVNCPICGAQFSTADQMNSHARQEHQR